MGSATQSITVTSRTSTLLRDYVELFKARVTALIVVTAACGSYFAAAQSGDRMGLAPDARRATGNCDGRRRQRRLQRDY